MLTRCRKYRTSLKKALGVSQLLQALAILKSYERQHGGLARTKRREGLTYSLEDTQVKGASHVVGPLYLFARISSAAIPATRAHYALTSSLRIVHSARRCHQRSWETARASKPEMRGWTTAARGQRLSGRVRMGRCTRTPKDLMRVCEWSDM